MCRVRAVLTVPNGISFCLDIGHALHNPAGVIPEAQPGLVVTNMAEPRALLDINPYQHTSKGAIRGICLTLHCGWTSSHLTKNTINK